MPGGDPDAWKDLEPIWKADRRQGRREDRQAARGRCARQAGRGRRALHRLHRPQRRGPLRQDGAQRHRVRRHADDLRGLRAADAICWACRPPKLGEVFTEWNKGDLDSFLIQITADILQQKDPVHDGKPFVDVVLDTAGQKGTGKWTSVNALDMGVPAPTDRRSRLRPLHQRRQGRARRRRRRSCPGPQQAFNGDKTKLIAAVRDALYCSKICSYAQGFQLMRAAQNGIQLEAQFRRDRQHLARRLHHPGPLPAEDHRGLPARSGTW